MNWARWRRAAHVTTVAATLGSFGPAGCHPQSEAPGSGSERHPRTTPLLADEFDTQGRIGADAGQARYPLSSAPLTWAELQKLTAIGGEAADIFGRSITLDGNIAIAGGSNGDTSADSAFVFARNAESWTQTQELRASDTVVLDRFGCSLALQANTLIIGAYNSGGLNDYTGAAYVFTRSAGNWTEQQKLSANDGATSDQFGLHVALSGNTAIVGAPGDDDAGSRSGSAYVFTRNAGSWTQEQKLKASDAAWTQVFGDSLTVEADEAIIGARGDSNMGSQAGAAYVFTRSATTWAEQQKLTASDGAISDQFGANLALDAGTAIIGAANDNEIVNNQAQNGFGSVYVFTRNATTWTEGQKLRAGDGADSDHFGTGLALEGDTALIGAPDDDDAGSNEGSAYIFTRNAGSWTQEQKLSANDGTANAKFGASVALSGDTALIGAGRNDDTSPYLGSAYVMALRRVNGQACVDNADCASKLCVDGYCCDSACDGACDSCNAVGQEGVCTLALRGDSPSADCGGHRCNGERSDCPSTCGSDPDCLPSHYCQDAAACLPKTSDGQACFGDSSCLSGHCVDGICCEEACDDGCGTCSVAGFAGNCRPHAKGHPGTPACTPYLCAGSDAVCPASCAMHRDCSLGNHCEDGVCRPHGDQGSTCTEDGACATGHCTDATCCVAPSCGAYRCGSAGACEATCSSSAQCANGYACNSAGRCEPQSAGADGTEQDGACHVASASAPRPGRRSWLGALGIVTCLGAARKRRRAHREP